LVNERCWLFVNIPYPLLSEPISTLIGNLIITKIFYACMQREPGSAGYRLILDEARFFNTGPLDRLLETSRAYNLWLTMVVQSLNQMCRSREGRVDESLREIALSVVRYWATFHVSQKEDALTLSTMMFPVTGQEVIGVRSSGDWERKPVQAEEDEHARRFMRLRKREAMLYDKLSGSGPRAFYTPEVVMDEPTQARVDLFEAQHLQLTGRPASEIMREILDRRGRIQGMFSPPPGEQPARRLGPPAFGGS